MPLHPEVLVSPDELIQVEAVVIAGQLNLDIPSYESRSKDLSFSRHRKV